MRPAVMTYGLLGVILTAFAGMLIVIVVATPGPWQFGQKPQALIQPVVALAGLTALVWCLMVAWRNVAVIRGNASLRYFRATRPTRRPNGWSVPRGRI